VLDENFEITIGRAACEAYRATWTLGTNSAFALRPRKATENLDSNEERRLLGYKNPVRTSQETAG
jgi:hypothetical protein